MNTFEQLSAAFQRHWELQKLQKQGDELRKTAKTAQHGKQPPNTKKNRPTQKRHTNR